MVLGQEFDFNVSERLMIRLRCVSESIPKCLKDKTGWKVQVIESTDSDRFGVDRTFLFIDNKLFTLH